MNTHTDTPTRTHRYSHILADTLAHNAYNYSCNHWGVPLRLAFEVCTCLAADSVYLSASCLRLGLSIVYSYTNVCCCPTYPHTHRSQHNFGSKFETQHTTLWGFHYQMSSWLTSRNSRFIHRISRQKTHGKDFRLWKVDNKIFTKDFP